MKWAGLLLFAGMVVAMLPAEAAVFSNFNDGSVSHTEVFYPGGGSSSLTQITLPTGDTVLNASIQLNPALWTETNTTAFTTAADFSSFATTNIDLVTSPGDIRLATDGNAQPFYSDDFENPFEHVEGWTSGGGGDDWEVGLPSDKPSNYDGSSNCYGTNLNNNYSSMTNSWLKTPSIPFKISTKALKFKH